MFYSPRDAYRGRFLRERKRRVSSLLCATRRDLLGARRSLVASTASDGGAKLPRD